MKYHIDQGHIWLAVPFQMRHLAGAIPGALWDNTRKGWKYCMTPNTAYELLLRFSPHMTIDLQRDLTEMRDGILNASRLRDEDRLMDPMVVKSKPWPHQNTTYWMARSIMGMGTHRYGGGFCAALDMGAGKSKVLIDLWQNSDIQMPLLIVAPHAVTKVWPVQFERHCHYDVQPLVLGGKLGVEKKTQMCWNAWQRAKLTKEPFVAVINYESVWREPDRKSVV